MGIFSSIGGALGLGGGSSVRMPTISPEQRQLMELQATTAQQLLPQYAAYSERAIRGEEPISPALEASLQERQRILEADIARRGGPSAAAMSTAGIQRLAAFQRGADITREEARQRAIGLGGQLVGVGADLTRSALAPYQQQYQTQLALAQQRMQQEAQAGGAFGGLVASAGLGALTGGLGLLGPGIGALGGAGIGALGGGGLLPLLGGRGGGGAAGGGAGTLQSPVNTGGGYSISGGYGLRPMGQ